MNSEIKLKKINYDNGMTSFIIVGESYTLVEPLVFNIRNDKRVNFAGYIKEHPLENHIEIRIRTKSYDENVVVFEEHLSKLIEILQNYKEKLDIEL